MPRRNAEPRPGETARHLRARRKPRQARARVRVEAILEATAELLGELGADTLTTADIAARAGIPIGSVYHYFPSKEAVLAELADRKFRAIDAAVAAHLGEGLAELPWRRALERALDAGVAAFRGDPTYVAVWRAMRASSTFRSVARASDERFARALAALPVVSSVPAARARVALRAAIRLANAFLDWILEEPDPREAAAIAREMKRALVAYLAPDLDAAERAPRRAAAARRRPVRRRA
jgi:AcrR family transcriptional regulator